MLGTPFWYRENISINYRFACYIDRFKFESYDLNGMSKTNDY